MAPASASPRSRLVEAVEHCYYSGPTAGQMWLHDLSTYLQQLADDDARLQRLAQAADDPIASAEEHLCAEPQPLAQAFHPQHWLDQYVERFA